MRKIIASYNECEIVDIEVKYRLENKEEFDYDDDVSEDKIREDVWNDPTVFDNAYNDMTYYIGEAFKKKFKTLCTKVEGTNLDWRNSSGYKYICLDQQFESEAIGWHLIDQIKPNISDFTLECRNYDKGLHITIYHHDCPTGSQFYLTPCARSTYEKKTS